MNQLKIFKTHPSVVVPKFATQQSACFDLSYQPAGKTEYTGYNSFNSTFTRPLTGSMMVIMPGDRVMVPTGIIFDIPKGYSVRIHPRSGLSYKKGLVLANLEAVIDSDYVEETYILLTNRSENALVIEPGERVAQAEMIVQVEYDIVESAAKPGQKTDRVGGMGSTGVSVFAMTDAPQSEAPPVKRGRGRPRKVVA